LGRSVVGMPRAGGVFLGGRGAGEGRPARAARRWGPPGDKVAGLRNSAR
jgi:hypothetical protein